MAYIIQDDLIVRGDIFGPLTGNLTGTSSYATKANTTDTITVSSFGSPVESYLLMSNVVATTGVAIGGDSDLRYNSSTNVLTVPNISATTLTGSLFGTSSWATNFVNASNYVLNSVTSSMLAPYVLTSNTGSMLSPYVLTSTTSSMLAPYVLTANTSSMLAPYMLIANTSSMLTPYMLVANTSSMLAPYVLTSVTSSMLAPYLLINTTASFATTGSNRFNGNQTITGSVTISSSADPQFVIGNNLLIVSSSGQLGVSGSIIPNVHNTYTLGTTNVRFQTLFVQGTVNGNTGLFNNINMGSSTPMSIINNGSMTVAQWYGLTANLRMQSGSTPAYVDNGYRLQINSLGAVSGGLYITGSATQNLIRVDSAGVNGLLLVSSSGNIGIGTLTPNYKLDILNGAISIAPSGALGPASVALIVSGSGTKGGAAYVDFLQVTNTTGSATNPNKYFRVDNNGSLQILNSAYTSVIFSLADGGILSVGGGNAASSSNQDAVTNYLSFNSNNSQIYDDGNTHIHSRGSGQSMWINTNNAQLNLLTQAPVVGGATGSGVAIGGSTLTGYVTINNSKAYTTAANYGYLTTAGAGTYPGGSQTVNVSLYATQRIWGQEIDAFSDERMKDIQGNVSLDEGIQLVKTLQPIKYTWKDNKDGGLKIGYSAQQVAKAGFSNLISLIPKEGLKETIDEDGFVSPKDTQFSMNYDQVTPYHGVVIKHLLEKIEQLEKEIQLLKEE